MKTYFFQMKVKSVDNNDDKVIISGFASTPDIDRYDEIVEPEAFRKALELYMKNPVMLRSHDPDRPIGTVTSALITEKGLKIEAEIIDERTKEEIRDGRMRAMSIGYRPLVTELQHRDGTPFNFEKDDVWDEDIVRVIKELDLVEISIVATPANGNALFTIQKSIHKVFNDLTVKSFMLEKKNETKDEVEETTEETTNEVADETTNEAETSETEATETTDETETSEAETEATDEAEETTEKSISQEVENEGETPSPATEVSDETSGDEAVVETESEKLFVTAKDAGNLRILTAVGAVEVKDNAKALPKEYKEVLELADKALELARKHIEELEAKLDNYPQKKALVVQEQRTASKSFLSLFGINE